MVGIADHLPSMPLRRKKWTEEEEETLICKYGELLRSGFLSKTKSRERKFEPVAVHVNAHFNAHNPVAYPWLWTWKDVSTKVQNMRHQYLGVKAKIRKLSGEHEVFDWEDGLSQWSNFLKYKDVFGDQELDVNDFFTNPTTAPPARHHRSHMLPALPTHQQHLQHPTRRQTLPLRSVNNNGMHSISKDLISNGLNMGDEGGELLLQSVKDSAASVVDQAVLDEQPGDLTTGLDFGYDGDEHGLKEGDDNYDDDEDNTLHYGRLKRARQCGKLDSAVDVNLSETGVLAFIASQFAELNERAALKEERDMEKEKEWEKRQASLEAELTKQKHEWEKEKRGMEEMWHREMDRRDAERQEQDLKRMVMEQERREMERERDKAREEKMEHDKMEWREKMERQAMQHQAAMMQIQLQISQNQQSTLNVLSGALLQIASHGNEFLMQGSSISPFVSQLLQNLQTHGNGVVPCNMRRGGGESSDSQFDADG